MSIYDKQDSDMRIQTSHTKTKHIYLGVVGPDSPLLREEIQDGYGKKSRWHPVDWILGTKPGQMCGLVICATLLILFGSLLWMTTGGNSSYDTSFSQSVWFAWGMFFDPGTQMGFAADEPRGILTLAACFSVCGFVYNLLFLGLIVDFVRNALAYFRLKRSRIIANQHTLLLGWTEKSLFVMEELIGSAENRGQKANLVVLCEQDTFSVREDIDRHFMNHASRKLIQVRQGSPSDCSDLARASAFSAKEIIILSPSMRPRQADLSTVRTVVALAALPQHPQGAVIAEVRAAEMSPCISQLMDRAEGVFARDAVNRVLVLQAVQPLMGEVFLQLMSWSEGSEIYAKKVKHLGITAKTFGEAFQAVTTGIVIGFREQGLPGYIAPPSDMALNPSDMLLIVAESEKTLLNIAKQKQWTNAKSGEHFWGRQKRSSSMIQKTGFFLKELDPVGEAGVDNAAHPVFIMIGWPDDMDDIIVAFDDYCSINTTVYILARLGKEERERRLANHRGTRNLKNIRLQHRVGNTTSLHSLADLPLDEAFAVIVLSDDTFGDNAETADSSSLATTITLDGLLDGNYPSLYNPCQPTGKRVCRLICEVVSPVVERALPKTHKLRSRSKFFPSCAIETGLFSIASAQACVYNTLLMLLQPNNFGNLVAHPVDKYIDVGEEGKRWEEVSSAVRRCEDVAIGFHIPCIGAGMGPPPADDRGLFKAGSQVLVATRTSDLRQMPTVRLSTTLDVRDQRSTTTTCTGAGDVFRT